MINNVKKLIFITLFTLIICLISCANTNSNHQNNSISLAENFKGLFYLGAAINEPTILGNDSKSKKIVINQFNSITPENSLKWMFIQPSPNYFNFTVADKYVDFGIKNNMHIVGHALIWHSQLADFMHNIESKAEMTKHFENHINTVVSRYKGKINAWDVVNEAFNEDGSMRESIFYKLLGKNYICLL